MVVRRLTLRSQTVTLSALGQRVRIRYQTPSLHRPLLVANLGALAVPRPCLRADFTYRLGAAGSPFSLAGCGRPSRRAASASDMLYLLDQSLIVELQKRRADLFFLHAAALERNGHAFLLAAESGGGKSTLAWALLHHGFGYLSDELAPIDPETMHVHPYPRALCLKRAPPPPYRLPDGALDLGRTIHLPAPSLPGPLATEPRPIAEIFFLRYTPGPDEPALQPLTPAEAAARLYVCALNPLAHADRGLAPALRIAKAVPSYALTTAGLTETCRLVASTVDAAAPC